MTSTELRALLDEYGVSQSELARRLQMNRGTIFRYANGSRAMPYHVEKAIRHVVECEIHDETRAR